MVGVMQLDHCGEDVIVAVDADAMCTRDVWTCEAVRGRARPAAVI
jgi:hypothetical protein